MTNKTILVLGTNAGQADLIRHMKDRGWTVVACANQAGLPGEFLADRFELIDICDIDAVSALAKELGADLVYSVSSDIAMKAAVQVCEKVGLPHFYDSKLIHLLDQKHELRAHLTAHGLSEVPFLKVTDANQELSWSAYPCMVKPSDAQGQRGVKIVNSADALKTAVAEAIQLSPQKCAIVEQYLTGVEVSANVLVSKGEIVVNEVSERLVHQGALYGIPKGHLVPPYNVTEAMQEATRELVRQVVKSLDIQNGCLYFQMKITPEGPKIIEIAPRLDGCHMWRLIRHARGFDFLAATIDVLLGQEPKTEARPTEARVHELIFQQTPPGNRFSLAAFPKPADAQYHEYRYQDGEIVKPINGLMDVVGYYVRPVMAAEAEKFVAEKQA